MVLRGIFPSTSNLFEPRQAFAPITQESSVWINTPSDRDRFWVVASCAACGSSYLGGHSKRMGKIPLTSISPIALNALKYLFSLPNSGPLTGPGSIANNLNAPFAAPIDSN